MDQLRRSVKKHKRNDEEEEQSPITDMDMEQQTLPMWHNGTFAKVLQRRSVKPSLYIGEGEEDSIDDLRMTDILLNQNAVEEGELCPVAQIP